MIQKRTILVSLASVCLLTASSAMAQHAWDDPSGWWSGHFDHSRNNAPLYSAQEVSLDLFASYINPEGRFGDLFETNIRNGFWGGGAGLNYFFTRELGLGADFNISSKPDDLNLVDQVTGNFIARLPLGNSGVAPYLIGSGGRAMSPRYDWVYGGGVGLEMRLNPSTGIFSDARFLWSDRSTSDDRLLIRAGVRLTF
jgi:hypothetical protein